MRAIRKRLRSQSQDPGLYTRVVVSAEKLALIRACGVSFDGPRIEESDALWGASLARYLFDAMSRRIATSVSDNATETATKRVGEIIRKTDRRAGIAKQSLTRKTQWLRRGDRNDILRTLEESEQIRAQFTKVGKSRRTTYFWIGG